MTGEIFLIIICFIISIAAAGLYALQSKQFARDKDEIRFEYETRIVNIQSAFNEYAAALKTDNKDLRDRLFIKHGLAPTGVNLTEERAIKIEQERQKKLNNPNPAVKAVGPVAQAQQAAIDEDNARFASQSKI